MSVPLVIAIDIEGAGPNAIKNGIVSIGVCVGASTERRVIEKARFDLEFYPDQTMDAKCKAEFWDKNDDLFERLTANRVPPSLGMKAFREFIDKFGDDVYIVSDTPSYDFHFIGYYLDREGLMPLTHDKSGNFRPLHDSDSYARGSSSYNFTRQWVSNSDIIMEKRLVMEISDDLVPELVTHMPEDDAENIYRFHQALVQKLN